MSRTHWGKKGMVNDKIKRSRTWPKRVICNTDTQTHVEE